MSDGKSYFHPAKNVLLTGAGFTKSFGGYLASEMWAIILNQPEVSQDPKLRRELLKKLDYERCYDYILNCSLFMHEEKNAFTVCVEKAYGQLHEIVCSDIIEQISKARTACRSIIAKFAGENQELGFFFTLNQDLLIERLYPDDSPIRIPGLHSPKWFNLQIKNPLAQDEHVQLPDSTTVDQEKSKFWDKNPRRFAYVKLHGSYGWKGITGNALVIGNAKTEVIKNEPLLKWYLTLFDHVLKTQDRNLVVIGYGFRDPHINDVIADGIRHCGLKLFVISPKQPSEFRDMLQSSGSYYGQVCPSGHEIWEGLHGYYLGSVTDLYHHQSNELTVLGEKLFQTLQ